VKGMDKATPNDTVSNGSRKPRQVFIPYMCDHGYTLAAAMRAHNLPTEVLPPTSTETLGLGLNVCKGRECLPCITTTGDFLQRSRQPGFDPEQAAVFMPTTLGSCRFGCYNVLQKDILEEQGLGQIEIMAPSSANSYRGFGDQPTKLRMLMWQGVVAIDLLHKLLHGHRPYELQAGQTDDVYKRCVDQVVAATEAGGGKELVEAMHWTARQFEMIPVDRSIPRPLIGLVGEIYLRFNTYVNLELVRQVEELGGEVRIASSIEWLYYTNWHNKRKSHIFGKTGEYIKTHLTDMYQRYYENNLLKPVEHLLRHPHESPTSVLMKNLKPYYHPDLGSEAILSMSTAIDFARRSFGGILNVMPFSCMPGTITTGIAPSIRADLDNIPWLDISYDTQGGTNLKTRLEAFMYQVFQYHRRIEHSNKN
jgi:predicted nucleotide-binding protein (sugar kinase/HSP70/actin superfamily)